MIIRIKDYPFVYVNADGTVRELHPRERQYLETKFQPGDGGAPYVKKSFELLNGWGEIRGFLERKKLPMGTAVQDAPKEDPVRLLNEQFTTTPRNKGTTGP